MFHRRKTFEYICKWISMFNIVFGFLKLSSHVLLMWSHDIELFPMGRIESRTCCDCFDSFPCTCCFWPRLKQPCTWFFRHDKTVQRKYYSTLTFCLPVVTVSHCCLDCIMRLFFNTDYVYRFPHASFWLVSPKSNDFGIQ